MDIAGMDRNIETTKPLTQDAHGGIFFQILLIKEL